MLSRIERFCRGSATALAVAGLSLLLVFAAATLLDGLLRSLIHQPIDAVRDLSGVIVALSVACCVPIGLMERSMITIQIADSVVGPRLSRLLDAVASLVTGIIIGFLALEIGGYASELARSGETTWMMRVPLSPFWWCVDVVLWCGFAIQVIVIVLEAARVMGREWRAGPSGSEMPQGLSQAPAPTLEERRNWTH